MAFARNILGVLALLVSARPAVGQRPPGHRAAASVLGARVIEAGELTIDRIDLGRIAIDTNRFTALVTNKGRLPRQLGLSIRTVPGLWVPVNWQRGYRFEIPARSRRRIEAPYVFRRLTTEATLRIQFGTPHDGAGGVEVVDPVFDTALAVGVGNPAASDPRISFDTASTDHFEVFAWRGSAAARQMAAIAAGREDAVRRIAAVLGVSFTGRIRLVFYPDSATKRNQTGHLGNGFASDRTIVEIYNDSVQLDPYHEVAHIVAAERGSPPAFLDEGFAVHVSELLGADALMYLGGPGKTVREVVCGYSRAGRLIPLERLARFTEIGSDSTQPIIAYPEAASITAFLIETFGSKGFGELYARLGNGANEAALRRNAQLLETSLGRSLEAIERNWTAWLACSPTAPGGKRLGSRRFRLR